ncbi:MAG: pyridoxal 5'-phosphate synthase, partial [Thermoanaerobaculia bacterium]
MSATVVPLAEPFARVREILDEAAATGMEDPNAMVVSTVDAAGQPSSRVVLLKGFDERGFVFFTDYRSRKGEEIEANPRAALVFYWSELERQVRITGGVALVSREDSEHYYTTRPLG